MYEYYDDGAAEAAAQAEAEANMQAEAEWQAEQEALQAAGEAEQARLDHEVLDNGITGLYDRDTRQRRRAAIRAAIRAEYKKAGVKPAKRYGRG